MIVTFDCLTSYFISSTLVPGYVPEVQKVLQNIKTGSKRPFGIDINSKYVDTQVEDEGN